MNVGNAGPTPPSAIRLSRPVPGRWSRQPPRLPDALRENPASDLRPFVSSSHVHRSAADVKRLRGQDRHRRADWCIQPGKGRLSGRTASGKTTCSSSVLGSSSRRSAQSPRNRGLLTPTFRRAHARLGRRPLRRGEQHVRQRRQLETGSPWVPSSSQSTRHRGRTRPLDDRRAHSPARGGGGIHTRSPSRLVLGGLCFAPETHLPIAALSGGQKCRAALAKLMIQEADLLLIESLQPPGHPGHPRPREVPGGYHGAAVFVFPRPPVREGWWTISPTSTCPGPGLPCPTPTSPSPCNRHSKRNARVRETTRVDAAQVRVCRRGQTPTYSRSAQAAGGSRPSIAGAHRQGDERDQQARGAWHWTSSGLECGRHVCCGRPVCARPRRLVLLTDGPEVYRGQKIGIIGHYGVGKTTLLKMAMNRVPWMPARSGCSRASTSAPKTRALGPE